MVKVLHIHLIGFGKGRKRKIKIAHHPITEN